MNDGIFFYLAAWSGWIFFTFIHEKNSTRMKWALSIMTVILLSGHEVVREDVTAGLTSLGFLCFSFIGISIHPFFSMLRLLMISFMVMMLIVLLHVFFLYDPAMLIAPRFVLVGMFAAALCLAFVRTEGEAFLVLLTGLVLGDFLFQLVVFPLKGYIETGSKEFLDVASVSFVALYTLCRASQLIKSANKLKPARKITLKR